MKPRLEPRSSEPVYFLFTISLQLQGQFKPPMTWPGRVLGKKSFQEVVFGSLKIFTLHYFYSISKNEIFNLGKMANYIYSILKSGL